MRNVAHFDSNWPTLKLKKKFVRASPKAKLENYESVQHRLQFSGIKKGAKISVHRHFKQELSNREHCDYSAVTHSRNTSTKEDQKLPPVKKSGSKGPPVPLH